MQASQIILIIISGLGVIHGVFLAIFLWGYKSGSTLANRLLSALLMVLSFRIGKSVFFEFIENLDVKIIFIGLGTMMIMGPLFYFYAQAVSNRDFKLTKKHLTHFIPAFIAICFGFWIEDEHQKTLPIMFFLACFLSYYGHYLTYMIVTYRYISRQKEKGLDRNAYNLLLWLLFGLLVIWVVYVLNLFDEIIPYIVGPVLYSLVAYVVSYIVISKGYLTKVGQEKYRTTTASDEQIDQLFSGVTALMKDQKLYLSPDISLKELSKALHTTSQMLSMAINSKHGQNFNSFINQYRIDTAITLFADSKYAQHTISSIAFEVGFNSISSFNTAFKKQTGKTPKAYRQDLIK